MAGGERETEKQRYAEQEEEVFIPHTVSPWVR
jgi:hypothetical protein